jgi:hypothetical protein
MHEWLGDHRRKEHLLLSAGHYLIRSKCHKRFEEEVPELGDAVDDWYYKCGPGLLACPGCHSMLPITDWEHDPAWTFADLGFQFWNWPLISPEFIQAIAT